MDTACGSKLNKQTNKQHEIRRQITWEEEGGNGGLEMSEHM